MRILLAAVVLIATSFSCKWENKKDSAYSPEGASVIKQQDTVLQKSMERGAVIYEDFCLQCHLATGEGVAGTFPPLKNSNWLTEKREASIRSVKFGLQGEITVNGEVYNSVMANPGLDDEEIRDVMNYILNSWGNNSDTMVTLEEVKDVKEE